MFFHIRSIIDLVPLVLYPRGEVCEEESKELEPNTVIELLMIGYFQSINTVLVRQE